MKQFPGASAGVARRYSGTAGPVQKLSDRGVPDVLSPALLDRELSLAKPGLMTGRDAPAGTPNP